MKTLSTHSSRFIFAFILFPFLIQAQNESTKIDSLAALLPTTTEAAKFQLLFNLFNETKDTDFEAAHSYAQQANLVAKELGDSVLMMDAGRIMAYALDDLGRTDEALVILRRIIGFAERNLSKNPELKLKLKGIYNNAGVAYMFVGKYDSSLSYHLKSLELREAEGDSINIGRALNNIGLVYYKLKNSKKALEYYLKSYSIRKSLGRFDDLTVVLVNIGLCYNAIEDYSSSLESFQEALSICKDNCSENLLKQVYLGLGLLYRSTKDYIKSTDYLQSSLRIARNKSDVRYIIDNLIELGKNELSLKNFRKSLTYLDEAIALARTSSFTESKINILHELAKVYSQLKDFEKKTFYQDQYISLKDSIYNESLLRNLLSINSGYEERANLQIIQEKEKALALQKEIIERQRLQTILVAIISGLFLFIIILLYSNYRKKAKFEVILEERVKSRTAELETSRFALEQQNFEHQNIIQKAYSENKSSLATIRGVFQIATRELNDPISIAYFFTLQEIVGRIEESFKILHHKLTTTGNLKSEVDFLSINKDVTDQSEKDKSDGSE